ncbi:hypothetical protein [Acinetobacter sp. ANC 3882]|uniref:hypothetical protein n=1 Tax=Acinetobacter sp. ANC 3882 TaxID=2923423 RepID=UPI001F4B2E80|nr:hypothetical protein [Acinetobacter sp. ANC 3882]MCH7315786.1 hypothetical protein [Acinetobacter sp. ANC 3882]
MINPFHGVGPIILGSSVANIKKLFGTELYYEDWMGGNLENFLFYQGLLIGFHNEGSDNLTDISKVSSVIIKPTHELILWNEDISNFSKQQITNLLKKQKMNFKEINKSFIECKQIKIRFGFNSDMFLEQLEITQ